MPKPHCNVIPEREKPSLRKIADVCASALIATGVAMPAIARQSAPTDEQITVYGELPSSDVELSADKIPTVIQSVNGAQVNADHGATVLDVLSTQIGGVSLTDTQGNGMSEDLRFHGFTASPLQGTPQGIAVYQNGVRLNEAFGDTLNWDAIPSTAIARLDVWSSNPVFGRNAIGGAINLVMKNGFTWQGEEASAQAGSYGHGMTTFELGRAGANIGFYAAVEGVTDGGWRLHSASNIGRFYADLAWRTGQSEAHLVASGAQSKLGAVGPTPIQLIKRNSASVYTNPQTTNNMIGGLSLHGKSRIGAAWEVQGLAYVRALRQRHRDGNISDFGQCDEAGAFDGFLCLREDESGASDGAAADDFVLVNQSGAPIPFDPAAIYGTMDRTATDTTTLGATLQLTSNQSLWGLNNYLSLGGSVDHSAIAFRSRSILGSVSPSLVVRMDSGVLGSGDTIHTLGGIGYVPVNLAASADNYGLYVLDALDLTGAMTLTGGLRLNVASMISRDRTGGNNDLNGAHGYSRLNPMGGISYRFPHDVTAFAGYSQANRTPTPVELNCSSPLQPCILENSLVADPALKQVVARTWESGLRGKVAVLEGIVYWTGSLFRTMSDDDIVSLASPLQGRSYFANVPSTRRQGADISARIEEDGWSAYLKYSYLDATYQFSGTLASPNNPGTDGNGNVVVTPGRHIPLNSANSVRAGGDVKLSGDLALGWELVFDGSRYFDGDQANQNPKLPSRLVVNLHGSYRLENGWKIFGVIRNLFDRHDPTYGTYFSTADTEGLLTPALSDPRSLTLEQPLSVQLGVSVSF